MNCLKCKQFLTRVYQGHGKLLIFRKPQIQEFCLIETINLTQQTFHPISVGGFFKSLFTYTEQYLKGGRTVRLGLKQIIDAERVATNKKTGLKQPGNGFLTAQNVFSGQFISLQRLWRCQSAPSFPY